MIYRTALKTAVRNPESASLTGHASLKEIVRYTKTADRKRLAASAMEKVKAGTSIVKPVARFDKKRKKS
jgi:hypothetical protein